MTEPRLPTARDTIDMPFRAVLTPHRSLSKAGFLVLMLVFAGACFSLGAVFYALGAWPVVGFLGLDVLAIFVAFQLNYRAARAYEMVEVTPETLTVTRVDPRGRHRRFDFNPYWAKVLLFEFPDGRNDLRLAAQGRELSFGRFLTDDERRDFADALKGALLQARGGPRI